MKNNPNGLLADWLRRAKKAQIAYTRSATHYEKLHYWLGGTIIILSVLSAMLLFSTNLPIKVASFVSSIVSAILAWLQTFYRFSDRAEKYRITGIKYGELRMELEQKIAFPYEDKGLEQYVESVRNKWNRIREESPSAPQRIWDTTVVDKEGRYIRPENS